jgi:protein-histidine N-methyltransferase
MSFSFGFSGDDIEEDPNDVVQPNQQEQDQAMDVDGPAPIPARAHDLDEMVGTHPQGCIPEQNTSSAYEPQ